MNSLISNILQLIQRINILYGTQDIKFCVCRCVCICVCACVHTYMCVHVQVCVCEEAKSFHYNQLIKHIIQLFSNKSGVATCFNYEGCTGCIHREMFKICKAKFQPYGKNFSLKHFVSMCYCLKF